MAHRDRRQSTAMARTPRRPATRCRRPGPVTGTYQWNASYASGDGNNNDASDIGATDEQVPVTPASPAIATTPNLTGVTLGTTTVTLLDSAVLSGGYFPTGTITFTLVAPGAGRGHPDGDGQRRWPYLTPTGYTLPTTGTVTGIYQWNASYTSGDGNNNDASDVGATDEQVPVIPASPGIATTPNPTSATLDTTPVTLLTRPSVRGLFPDRHDHLHPDGGRARPWDTETVTVASAIHVHHADGVHADAGDNDGGRAPTSGMPPTRQRQRQQRHGNGRQQRQQRAMKVCPTVVNVDLGVHGSPCRSS